MASEKTKQVAIIHPDLGIGGAEQLIINVALALKERGFKVVVYTPHFDPNHCFEEAKKLDIRVKGSWFPRAIFGRMIALCAYIRMLLCSLFVLLCGGGYDYYILDQVSFPIPLLRMRNRNVMFYCHYPDKLLSTDRRSCIKRAYRLILDTAEEVTTGAARCIVVNSNFTKKVFEDNFPIIRKCCKSHKPKVIYPSIQEKSFVKSGKLEQSIGDLLGREITRDTLILTSLNRYERKKNIMLALDSFSYVCKRQGSKDSVLVIAGGYDVRLPENVEHHLELAKRAEELGISDRVVFLRSISNDQRLLLLENTKVLLYTPENEHFGIVPVEAMHLGCIVLACNSGGPLESVADGKTGYLMAPDAEEWGQKILQIVNGSLENLETMRNNAKKRVRDMFTFDVFAD